MTRRAPSSSAPQTSRLLRRLVLASPGICALLVVVACTPGEHEPDKPHEPSPNASILPSPLVSTLPLPLADAGQGTDATDAGDASPDASEPPAPTYFESDRELAAELAPALPETPGVELEAQFTWQPRTAGGRGDPRGRFPVRVELAASGRLRMLIESERMLLGAGTELRARVDRYGHLLLWPDASAYRVLNPGTLRALFEELRADVAPLQDAKTQRRAGGKVLGLPVQVDTIQTAMGTLVLEQSQVGALGGSGKLLCRLLLEFVLAKPDTVSCKDGWVPLKAEFGWADGGRFGFLATTLERKDFKVDGFSIPPPDTGYRRHELPEAPPAIWTTEEKLAKLEPGAAHKPEPGAPAPPAPPERGLLLHNTFDTPRYLQLNGELVAWVAPRGQVHLSALRPGGYVVVARDFLGIEAEQRFNANVPGRQVLGTRRGARAKP